MRLGLGLAGERDQETELVRLRQAWLQYYYKYGSGHLVPDILFVLHSFFFFAFGLWGRTHHNVHVLIYKWVQLAHTGHTERSIDGLRLYLSTKHEYHSARCFWGSTQYTSIGYALKRCDYNLVIGKRLKFFCGLPFGALGIVDRHSGFILRPTLFTHIWRHGRAGVRSGRRAGD